MELVWKKGLKNKKIKPFFLLSDKFNKPTNIKVQAIPCLKLLNIAKKKK